MVQAWLGLWFRPPMDTTPCQPLTKYIRNKVNPPQKYAGPHEMCHPPWKVPPPLTQIRWRQRSTFDFGAKSLVQTLFWIIEIHYGKLCKISITISTSFIRRSICLSLCSGLFSAWPYWSVWFTPLRIMPYELFFVLHFLSRPFAPHRTGKRNCDNHHKFFIVCHRNLTSASTKQGIRWQNDFFNDNTIVLNWGRVLLQH